MTESTHTYSAVLVGNPDIPVSIKGGRIALDDRAAPHVTGELRIAVPAAQTLASLDPRQTRRLRITANNRTFDLGLRERGVAHRAAEVTVPVASDEALLMDYAPLTDLDLYAQQGSLRALVNSVLGTVGVGALQPGADAALTSYWATENRLLNPSGEGATIAPWMGVGGAQPPVRSSDVARTGSYCIGVVSSTSTPVQVSPVDFAVGIPVSANKLHTLSVYARQFGTSPARSIRCAIRWVDQDGFSPAADALGAAVAMNDTTWQRAFVTAKAPAWAVRCVVFYTITGGTASGQITYLDDAMFNEGRLTDYLDGSTPNTAFYRYTWSSGAHASSSRRTPLVSSPDPDAFVWPAGTDALSFLRPLVQAAGRRLVCDEQRRWTLRGADYTAPGSLSVRHGVNLIDATDRIRRDDDLWFDAAVTVYTWLDAAGVQQMATDAFALQTPHTRLQRFERDTPYPGPGFSEYAVRRAQQRGREVTATFVPSWSEQAEQPVQIVLDGAPTQIGLTSRVTFDFDRDEATVTTRTTDTPFGAIDLLAGTIDQLVGTIDTL